MSREIKFRAWDKENEEMINIARFDFADYTIYTHLFACDGKLAENCEIMQYTGLNDKNGVEIYEGDVLKAKSKREPGFIVGDVVWNEYNLTYDLVDNQEYVGFNLSGIFMVEVIGNIYENPELLQEETQ